MRASQQFREVLQEAPTAVAQGGRYDNGSPTALLSPCPPSPRAGPVATSSRREALSQPLEHGKHPLNGSLCYQSEKGDPCEEVLRQRET